MKQRSRVNAWGAFLFLAMVTLVFTACEKDISVDLPEVPEQLVVEGNIEPGRPPLVILTRTQPFFSPMNLDAITGMFVGGATVTVTTGSGDTWVLDQLCSNLLDSATLVLAGENLGLDPALLAAANICIYTSLNPGHVGVEGETYQLHISVDDKELSSTTTIPHAVPLDSAWFKLAEMVPGDDSLGFAWGRFTDPDTMGNAYRWAAQRINHRADGSLMDPFYITPFGATIDDKYINGLTFDFSASRGSQPYANNPEDNNDERGFFKVGDTIAVKAYSIGRREYAFYRSYESNVASAGDIFSTPANVETNITGGLGIWVGRGVHMDTIVCGP